MAAKSSSSAKGAVAVSHSEQVMRLEAEREPREKGSAAQVVDIQHSRHPTNRAAVEDSAELGGDTAVIAAVARPRPGDPGVRVMPISTDHGRQRTTFGPGSGRVRAAPGCPHESLAGLRCLAPKARGLRDLR